MEKIISGLPQALKGRVKFAILFGSILTESFNKESDIDLALFLGHRIDLRERLRLQDTISKHFNHQYEFDLVVLDNADPIIAMQTLANGRPILVDDYLAFIKYKAQTISHYIDFKMDRKIVEDKIAEGSIYA